MDSPSYISHSIEELMIIIVYLVLRISLYREGRQTMDSPFKIHTSSISCSCSVEGLRITVACLVPKISLDREGRQTMDSPLVHRVDRVVVGVSCGPSHECDRKDELNRSSY